MLKGKLKPGGSFPKNGQTMFVFEVTGNEDELNEYLELQRKRAPNTKTNWVDEDGVTPLYFSSAPSGKIINLKITTNGNVVEDTTDLDLDAAMQANHDFKYNQVMAGLTRRAAGQTGAVKATPAPEKETAGAGNKSLED